MLVDLARNDLGRVARPGSVAVTRYMQVERFSHVQHIVSHVEAELREGRDALDALRAVFPAGTLSGAPKVRAMQLISELEHERRGVYGGAVGYLGYDGSLDTAIAIRSAVLRGGRIHVHGGPGIVAGSVPESEFEETEQKSAAIRRGDRDGRRDRKPRRQHSETCRAARGREVQVILVIDNYDSFTYNLVQALEAAEADVRVVRNDEIDADRAGALADDGLRPLRGIVISPGPGDPDDSGISMDAIELAREREIPLLGVCLGMQAIAAAFGASIVRAPTLVHGEASSVRHDARGFLSSMPLPFPAARYHSLCVDASTLPSDFVVSALADDGVVMGIRHRRCPWRASSSTPNRC